MGERRTRKARAGRAAGMAAVAAGLVLASGAGPAAADGGPHHGGAYWLHTEARFAPPTAFIPSRAVTYDMKRVPAASRIAVSEYADDEGMLIALRVGGLLPKRTYGAHVHTKPCGSRPDDSGPHYQDRKDPRQPSTDPAYANPRNEVWLDFTTNGKGTGHAVARHDWRFRPGGAASVVIHERRTSTGHGEAGGAGARLGCFTVPFDKPLDKSAGEIAD